MPQGEYLKKRIQEWHQQKERTKQAKEQLRNEPEEELEEEEETSLKEALIHELRALEVEVEQREGETADQTYAKLIFKETQLSLILTQESWRNINPHLTSQEVSESKAHYNIDVPAGNTSSCAAKRQALILKALLVQKAQTAVDETPQLKQAQKWLQHKTKQDWYHANLIKQLKASLPPYVTLKQLHGGIQIEQEEPDGIHRVQVSWQQKEEYLFEYGKKSELKAGSACDIARTVKERLLSWSSLGEEDLQKQMNKVNRRANIIERLGKFHQLRGTESVSFPTRTREVFLRVREDHDQIITPTQEIHSHDIDQTVAILRRELE